MKSHWYLFHWRAPNMSDTAATDAGELYWRHWAAGMKLSETTEQCLTSNQRILRHGTTWASKHTSNMQHVLCLCWQWELAPGTTVTAKWQTCRPTASVPYVQCPCKPYLTLFCHNHWATRWAGHSCGNAWLKYNHNSLVVLQSTPAYCCETNSSHLACTCQQCVCLYVQCLCWQTRLGSGGSELWESSQHHLHR